MASEGSKSSSSKTPPRFWAASFLVLVLLIIAGILWIPGPTPKRLPPNPEVVEVEAVVLPVEFVFPGPLNLNQASAAELEALPGIGPTLAARILAFREEHGPFRSVEDLLQVSGIGPKTLEGIRDKVTVGP